MKRPVPYSSKIQIPIKSPAQYFTFAPVPEDAIVDNYEESPSYDSLPNSTEAEPNRTATILESMMDTTSNSPYLENSFLCLFVTVFFVIIS